MHVNENKVVSPIPAARVAKKRGRKNGIKAGMLLKTHVEKTSPFRLSIIFMKTSELNQFYNYVDEKKDG